MESVFTLATHIVFWLLARSCDFFLVGIAMVPLADLLDAYPTMEVRACSLVQDDCSLDAAFDLLRLRTRRYPAPEI